MENSHFNKIFWFLAFMAACAMLYVFGITFIPIPKDNIRFADTTQGFFLGTIIGGIIAYFCTGNPPKVMPKQSDGTTTATITADIAKTETDEAKKPE